MMPNELDALLYRCESDVLDFKRESYRLASGDEEQGEFIKDLLAFANGWRAEDAHIVIGVNEVPGSRAEIVGITDHPDDSKLQQIVNSKTDAPVRFIYEPLESEGKKVGVVIIPVQARPRFLRKNFGKLLANTVYVRRGTSTAVADPTEGAKMALHDGGMRREVSLSFDILDHETGSVLTKLHFEPTLIDFGNISNIPDYGTENGPLPTHVWASITNTNRDYYREVAQYVHDFLSHARLRFRVTNNSSFVLRDVRVKFRIPLDGRILVAEVSDLQRRPEKDTFEMLSSMAEKIRQDVVWSVVKRVDEIEVSCHIGKIQPGDERTTEEPICLSATEKVDRLPIKFQIFSDDLPSAITSERVFVFIPQTISRGFSDVLAWVRGEKRPPE